MHHVNSYTFPTHKNPIFSQGFDIARTEVGLENEIQRDLKRKPPEPYRRRPDGSTELEGMYSAGETPPPKPMAYTNTPPGSRPREAGEGEEGEQKTQTLNRNKSRSQIPIDASLRRSLPPRPDAQETIHPPKKKSRLDLKHVVEIYLFGQQWKITGK